ncbi:LRR receptor-like serine/threonine-protein kinase GSO1 [Morus notabilis]|uniref:LRR receptor-like serine/threonine-protein kinase GSO1 n=1 Tax=Morus notabilis TaxID=981085 RepID=W9QKN1_9ROSA|nr:LRR receptor-like serine/threonine-protein kinase GSO1 [Morus notabilis]
MSSCDIGSQFPRWIQTQPYVSVLDSTFFARIQFLDLGNNELRGPIPDALHNMTAVRVLDLYGNYFNSTIPLSLVNSKSLVDLNLGRNEFENIEGGMLSILNKACSLRSLDLSGNSFLGDVLGSNKNSSRCLVYHLEYLSLTSGGISGDLPDYLGQLKGLKELNLAGNSFSGPIPSSLGELSALRSLHLENNQLKGIIPQSLGRLSSLNYLYLSRNRLNGTIPKSLGRLSNLEYLSLSHNLLTGSIPDSLGQLGNLWALHVSSNSLQGIVSELNFANLSRLRSLDVGSNNLSFIVKSDWIPPFSDLYYVNMSSCDIGSQFPRWIQTQKAVEILDFSNTNISGGFPIQHHYMNLYYLDLSTNKISGKLPMNIADKMPRLSTLLLPNNLMNGQLPDSLCKLDTLEVMDLSENRLSGEMPHCWRASQRIYLINLSSNKLSGTIPNSVGCLSFLKRLHIDKNNLTGVLPLALRNCKELEILDLGENKFSGSVPTWIGESLSSLRVLRLRNNMLSGSIPSQLCQLGELQILSLAYNNLRGRIPHCFGNLTGMIMEKFPSPISKQAVTSSRSEPTANPPEPQDEDTSWSREKIREVIKGIYLEYTKMQLQLLQFMDLSSNKLDGVIPEDLCRLSGLRGLNLSHNHFSGNIPNRIGELKLLESLDLSNNSLSGSIPSSMSALPSISHLNLSHNKLSGKIPTSNQLQTLNDPSIYVANLQLCGYPLPKCHHDSVQPPTSTVHKDEDHEDDKKEKILFYFVVFVGYATGLWGVIGTLVLKRNWRLAYFRFVDSTKDRIIVAVAVEVARLKQRMQRTNTKE